MPRFEQFRLPDAGEGLTEADIVQWHVAVGDRVEVNQTIVEIETAKSLVDLPCPYAGVVTQVLVEEGATVDVGTPIITVDTDPDAGPADAPTTPAAADSTPPTAAVEAAEVVAADAGTMQDPETETSGSGAVLVGYGVADHGTTRRARRAPGTPVATSSAADLPTPERVVAAAPARPAPWPAQAAPAPAQRSATAGDGSGVLAKPPVRKLAKDLGVDLHTVSPTGPGGIVTREDVVARAEQNSAETMATYPGDEPWLASGTVSPDGRTTRVPVRSVRKRTAEAMVASAFTAPHVSVFHTVDVTRTMRLVETLRADREFADVRVTPLLIAAKALLIAVNRHPEVNASWVDESQEIVYKHYVNLGIAAQTPRGLIVPNIKDAHRLTLHELALALADLTATAREGRTTPSAMSDGTITITNVGVFGIDTGTPILNPGESAILAFGAIRQQPWVHKGKVKARHVTQLALSFDHRLVDGALGAKLLADVAAVLEDPARALVWG
ncbi:dihydrolipoamide acetyltransferase family protein [Cellulomonas carbonis]|uniref:Dihydrolipoamide acetyltransferase component of pyruvate dehydrogenase complex n=1 Tax=Cellulomonas carbonis T26 TaxID=947969 RepID=A0A0A0BNH5_9CELL|nr:dihydrolipoamide acetyltransferase family protein [Cellulomonas carbonis]KGM10053.1 dihydrolipoyllysine acetyltransferase [Cellulomonas carbonis T26]GGC18329.1 dihydrolipoamide acetyltransferase component of pyruvate dehydrogenase complex [Cellulomonas carbonis]